MTALIREYRTADPPVLVAWPTNTVTLEDKFHNAVLSSKLQKIKDLAARGVNVDCFNEDGQTALFCGAFKGLTEVVSLLISLGAKPNARCQPEGYTALHGACYSGSTSILKMLIQAGGDLRICDHKRRTPKAWSLLQPDSTKMHGVHNVIESARLCTTETSGMEMLKEMQNSLSPRSSSVLGDVVRSIFRKSVVNRDVRSRNGIHINMDELRNGIHHTGFGKVYFGVGERCASVIGVPYISEVSDLEEEKDEEVPSWICGKFTSFNPKVWTTRKTLVSTRQLFTKAGPHCVPDILINELEMRSKLHHPNLLMLLGVCQTEHCEAVSLVYERVSLGSLYSVVHIDQKQLTPKFATDVIIQMCDALEYVHSMKLIHCGISSHAIMLVSNGVAKLSGFEYCLPENIHSETAMAVRHPILTSDAHLNVLRHWMAPEVLVRQQFSIRSDVYALCSVMWELCNLDLPWRTFTLQSLRQLYSSNPNEPLPINRSRIPQLWYHVLSLGLTPRRDQRDLEIAEIKDMMLLSRKPQAIQGSGATLFGSLRRSVVSSTAIPKVPEPESEDGLDVVDVADYCHSNAPMYRAASIASMPDRNLPGHECKGTNTSLWGKNSPSGDYFKINDDKLNRIDTGSNEDLMNIAIATKKESEKDVENLKDSPTSQPQGILKKFGFTTRSKSSVAVQSGPSDFVHEPLDDIQNPNKTTQTDIERKNYLEKEVQNRMSQDEDPEVGIRIVKSKKIGAILSLGMGWTKPFSNFEKKCKSVQTEAVSLRLIKRPPAGLSSPSPVPSPTSASTPLWHSFSNSKEPLDFVVDPEIKAARDSVKEKLNTLLKAKQAGDFPRSFSSMKLPKKASSIKPASHSIEGVTTSSIPGTANEYWNYVAGVSLTSHVPSGATGEKICAPAIKPAGHAVSLDRNGKVMMIQKVKSYRAKLKQTLLGSFYGKYSAGLEVSEENLSQPSSDSRSHLDLRSESNKEDMVHTGFVYEAIDKFNSYARGVMRRCLSYSQLPRELRRAVFVPQRYFSEPMDFQRQRIPWDDEHPCARIDGGDGRMLLGRKPGELLLEPPNPFQQSSHSIGIQCELSPFRCKVKDVSVMSNVSMPGPNDDHIQVTSSSVKDSRSNSSSAGSSRGSSDKESEGGAKSGSRTSSNAEQERNKSVIVQVSSSGTESAADDDYMSEPLADEAHDQSYNPAEPANSAEDVVEASDSSESSGVHDDDDARYETCIASPKGQETEDRPSHSSISTQVSEADEDLLMSPRVRSALSVEEVPNNLPVVENMNSAQPLDFDPSQPEDLNPEILDDW